jgi:choline monooxygenase
MSNRAGWTASGQKRSLVRGTLAGLSRDLKASGDYLTLSAGLHPLIVLCDESGALRAFHNICRHLGTELLEGDGNLDAARIIRPYHRWTYDLDGELKAVPLKKECFPTLDMGALHLHKASVAELKGLVFVHPDGSANFDDWLGVRLASTG